MGESITKVARDKIKEIDRTTLHEKLNNMFIEAGATPQMVNSKTASILTDVFLNTFYSEECDDFKKCFYEAKKELFDPIEKLKEIMDCIESLEREKRNINNEIVVLDLNVKKKRKELNEIRNEIAKAENELQGKLVDVKVKNVLSMPVSDYNELQYLKNATEIAIGYGMDPSQAVRQVLYQMHGRTASCVNNEANSFTDEEIKKIEENAISEVEKERSNKSTKNRRNSSRHNSGGFSSAWDDDIWWD